MVHYVLYDITHGLGCIVLNFPLDGSKQLRCCVWFCLQNVHVAQLFYAVAFSGSPVFFAVFYCLT